MSNMAVADLTSLVTGKYHIHAGEGRNLWSVRYYASDGTTHFCGYRNGRYQEWNLDRYVATVPFDMAGKFHCDPKAATPVLPENSAGWPIDADGDKGLLFSYS